jgi:hypothetical protein
MLRNPVRSADKRKHKKQGARDKAGGLKKENSKTSASREISQVMNCCSIGAVTEPQR